MVQLYGFKIDTIAVTTKRAQLPSKSVTQAIDDKQDKGGKCTKRKGWQSGKIRQ